MNIKIKLDLSRYSLDEIISLVKDGIITAAEVRESGVMSSFFNKDLERFINKREREEKCKTETI